MARPYYAGLIEVPEGKSVCVVAGCGRIVPEGVITCPSCARHLEKKMNAMDQPKHDRSGHY